MKITLVQRAKKEQPGEQPIYVRVSHRGLVRYISLGISVHPRHWNPRRQELRATHRDADDLGALLQDRLAKAEAAASTLLLTRGVGVSIEETKEVLVGVLHPETKRAKREPMLAWMREEVRTAYHNRGRQSSARAYTSILNRLEESLQAQGRNPKRFVFQDLTADVARAHRDRIEAPKTAGGEGHAKNYVHKQIVTLRALLARAVKAGVPGSAEALSAAQAVEVSKERVERVRVPIETVQAYGAMELTGRAADVRDWWCFAFYAGGVRLGDVCRLRWEHIERGPADGDGLGEPIAYRMRQQKTGTPMTLALPKQAAAIVRRWEGRTLTGPEPSPYVFGLLTPGVEEDPGQLAREIDRRGALARRHLTRVAEAKKWPKIGFHTARHSLAEHLRTSGKVSIYDISNILGHGDIATTTAYFQAADEVTAGRALRGAFEDEEE